MAAHSPTSPIIQGVPIDQPVEAWHTWLRQIADGVNQLASWAQQPLIRGLTFATLPVAPEAGTLVHITDGSVTTWGSVAAGGGSTHCILWWNGSNWKVLGV